MNTSKRMDRTIRIMLSVLMPCLLTCIFATAANAQTTAFTYQGHLSDVSIAANGTYQMQFALYDAVSGGAQQGTTITNSSVSVVNGIFTVQLDFSPATPFATGADRWIEIAVKKPAEGSYTTLTPRQPITSSPYSIRTLAAYASDSLSSACVLCVTDAHISGVEGAKVTGTVANATTATNVSGVVGIANGGTGSATKSFVDLSTDQTVGGNKTFTGTLSGTGTGLTNVPGTLTWQVVTGTSQQASSNTGYIANNAGQVTVTLPTSPNVGDVVRVTGIGLGGWKIAQNAGQSVTGQTLGIPTLVWAPRETNRDWSSVASSSDGTKLVAVVRNGQIYTSTDSGETWIPRDSNRDWKSVASSSDGTKLVAAAAPPAIDSCGCIYTSTDSGANWFPRHLPAFWVAVASSSDGTKLVAERSSGQIFTSTNSGLDWTPHDSDRFWTSVASSSDGTKLVAAVSGDTIFTSTDSGLTWTPRETARNWQAVASSSDGTKLVAAVSGGQIYTSTDSGGTWTARESTRTWHSVASSSDGTKLAAVVRSGGQIYTSIDSGVTWTPSDSNRDWRSVATSSDGTKLVAVVRNGQIYTSSFAGGHTTTGTAGYLTGGQGSSVELLYTGGGLFSVLSQSGAIYSF